jgi:hypothetical protein
MLAMDGPRTIPADQPRVGIKPSVEQVIAEDVRRNQPDSRKTPGGKTRDAMFPPHTFLFPLTRSICDCVYGSCGPSCLLALLSRLDKAAYWTIKQIALAPYTQLQTVMSLRNDGRGQLN